MTESAAVGSGALDLTDAEARVLGSLIEKEVTTPEYYPLSLNALVNACNQSSNRDPVMRLSDVDVRNAVNALRQRGLVRGEQGIGSRVQKFRQRATDVLNLSAAEAAVLDVLLLRGLQTVGEIRTRGQRLHEFASLADVEQVLQGLMDRSPPLVTRLARESGRKESRYAHLLCGEPAVARDEPEAAAPDPSAPAGDRVAVLEAELAELWREIADLRATLESFRRQFE